MGAQSVPRTINPRVASLLMPADPAHATPATLLRQIAASLDLPRELAPRIDEIFVDLHALGSSPRRVATLLANAGLTPRSRVLDLACGKGATAVSLASRIGCGVVGIDACAPFIASALELATNRNVGHLCAFRLGDVRHPPRGPFDAALMLGLFPISRAAPMLRRLVRKGGFYVIDDAFLDDRFRPTPPGLRAVPTRAQTREFIRALGDEVVAVDIPVPSQIDRLNRSLYRRISARARALADREPGLRAPISDFFAPAPRPHAAPRSPPPRHLAHPSRRVGRAPKPQPIRAPSVYCRNGTFRQTPRTQKAPGATRRGARRPQPPQPPGACHRRNRPPQR